MFFFSLSVLLIPGMSCDAGSFKELQEDDNCTFCAAGKFVKKAGKSACGICFPGKYNDLTGQIDCKLCEPGRYSSETSQTTCNECEPGGYAENEESTYCVACSVGGYQDESNQTACKLCPEGTYQDQASSTDCTSCAPGKFASTEGSITCVECSVGDYQEEFDHITCKECPKGKYQDQASSTSCNECAPGKVASSKGSITCEECALGKYTNEVSQTVCESCPNHAVSTADFTSCECPENYFAAPKLEWYDDLKADESISDRYAYAAEHMDASNMMCSLWYVSIIHILIYRHASRSWSMIHYSNHVLRHILSPCAHPVESVQISLIQLLSTNIIIHRIHSTFTDSGPISLCIHTRLLSFHAALLLIVYLLCYSDPSPVNISHCESSNETTIFTIKSSVGHYLPDFSGLEDYNRVDYFHGTAF